MTMVLGSVPVLGGLIVALRTSLAPAKSERPERFRLCDVSEVPDDDILERFVSFRTRLGPRVEDFTRVIFVTKDPDSGEILAMSGGPPPRPLRRLKIQVPDDGKGMIWLLEV
jgi:hypothetical protein